MATANAAARRNPAAQESEQEYPRCCFPYWRIVEQVAWSCSQFAAPNVLIIEAACFPRWGIVERRLELDLVARFHGKGRERPDGLHEVGNF
jgi:hypothetical protein